MYKFYNANSLGKFTDDCVIRSISCATDVSWDHVYDCLSDLAQEYDTFDCRNRIVEYVWLVK